jgi:hypothetical protein
VPFQEVFAHTYTAALSPEASRRGVARISGHRRPRPAAERGTVYIELALTMPVMALLILATLEFHSFFYASEEIHSLTRELAVSTYRDCSDAHITGTNTVSAIGDCLNNLVQQLTINENIGAILPGAVYLISVFAVDDTTGDIVRFMNIDQTDPRNAPLLARSHYSVDSIERDYADLLRPAVAGDLVMKVLVFSEVFYTRKHLGGLFKAKDETYETAMF